MHVLFQGGCGDGDNVADTPATGYPTYNCPETPLDSCPDKPGYDPVHNYMGCKYLQLYEFSDSYNESSHLNMSIVDNIFIKEL